MRYVKTGLTGYGPDLDMEDEPCESVAEVCYAISHELGAAIDMLADDAEQASEEREFERYHDARELSDKLSVMYHSLDWDKRKGAPLYRDDEPALAATMERIIEEHFPLTVDVDGYRNVYVWTAEDES